MTGRASSKERILVVDDDADWREFLRLNLEELGYETVEASNGRDALETLRTQTFSVVFLDLRMPGMDGEEVVQNLPAEHPQIVFLTSAPASEVGGALRSGPHYYLPKGATRQELSLMLESLGA
ncbi:MAG: response regulator [Myxococcaceae bacterium]